MLVLEINRAISLFLASDEAYYDVFKQPAKNAFEQCPKLEYVDLQFRSGQSCNRVFRPAIGDGDVSAQIIKEREVPEWRL